MAYYYGNVNPGKGGGSAFQRGKGGKLLGNKEARNNPAKLAYKAKRSNERFERTVKRLGY